MRCRRSLAVSAVSSFGRGRNADCSAPPAQTRAGAFNAHGSYLGSSLQSWIERCCG